MTGLILASLDAEDMMQVFEISLIEARRLQHNLAVTIYQIDLGVFVKIISSAHYDKCLDIYCSKPFVEVRGGRRTSFINGFKRLSDGGSYEFFRHDKDDTEALTRLLESSFAYANASIATKVPFS
jgi:hypothetical protein